LSRGNQFHEAHYNCFNFLEAMLSDGLMVLLRK
jgi:hypothetical protein